MDESSGNHEGHYIFGLHHNLVNLILYLRILVLKLQLPFYLIFTLNLDKLIFIQFGTELLFVFWVLALALKLVETVHDDVLWVNVFNSHHVEEHVVAEMEARV